MPTVPYNPIPSVSPQPVPRLRRIPQLPSGVPSEAFGGGVASQAGGLGDLSGVQNTAETIAAQQQRIRLEEKAKADQVAVTEAGADIATHSNKIWSQYQNELGKTSFDLPERASNDFWTVQNVIENGLANDDQRAAVHKIGLSEWVQLNDRVQNHVAQQRKIYDNESTQAALDAQQEKAVQNYTDPGTSEPAIAARAAIIMQHGERNGMPEEFTKEQVAKATSETRLEIVKQFVDNRQDLAASAYLTKYRDQFQSKDLAQAEGLVNRASVEGEGVRLADVITGVQPTGQLQAGNIDLRHRPEVKNADGTISTVRSISIEESGKTILIPTVSPDGKILSDDQAVALYHKTGQQLGVFRDEASAEEYAQRLHLAQADMLAGRGTGEVVQHATSESGAFLEAAKIADPLVREKTEERLSLYFNRQAASTRQSQEDAFEAGYKVLRAHGGDIDQVPMSLRNAMGAMHDENLIEQSKRLQKLDDPGDDERYLTLMNEAYFNPDQFGREDIPNVPGLSTTQKTRLMTLQRTVGGREQRQDEATIQRDLTRAQADSRFYKRRAETAGLNGDKEGQDFYNRQGTQADLEVVRLNDALKARKQAPGTTPVAPEQPLTVPPVASDQSRAPTVASPVASPQPVVPGRTRANPLGLTPVTLKPPTPQMLEDVIRKGPGYADYLRKMGIDVPLTVQPSGTP